MKNLLLLAVWGFAAWMLLGDTGRRNVVPAEEAAEKLREAWGDTHSAAS